MVAAMLIFKRSRVFRVKHSGDLATFVRLLECFFKTRIVRESNAALVVHQLRGGEP